ncbi:tRNA epoxyqueuosine(34) reductase QueG [Sedimentitalea sp. JM2-8]|uniref:Epoxyqueuosine reductase n=1 Tax=Sedimentitalea xiamensis TaxID=3050037 RepID=A0ABT7FIV9_9RHOB|nr:tRNA epoxyqueuosine(34) reductase QueG [Sedimentitalea xiamensis]MDK3075069.1 tRNA epoxyqueuosine(34) reductase QueG [Sedimentitalea xiamensis]
MKGAADLKARMVREAGALGFAACRVCRPWDVPEVPARLAAYLDAGYHGQMGWMAERTAWRGNPAALWPEARSVIMLAESYAPEHDPVAVLARPDRGAVSVYAQNRDYHDLVKKRLKRLARWLVAEGERDARDGNRVPLSSIAGQSTDAHANTFTPVGVKVFVDTAPVPEKALGQAAGLGWQGKHTNLVSRDWGNWAFIGSVFTTLELPADAPERDHCGSCRACLDVCPTDAFPAPYRLDARRCISYLTIEHKGPVAESLRGKLGNRIYGCDDCLAACPWNKFAVAASDMRYAARPDLVAPKLAELAGLDDAGFRALFSGSPVKRIGRDRFVRNVLYAIGNSGRPELRAVAQGLAGDGDPAVADAARWAAKRLAE